MVTYTQHRMIICNRRCRSVCLPGHQYRLYGTYRRSQVGTTRFSIQSFTFSQRHNRYKNSMTCDERKRERGKMYMSGLFI